METMGKTRGGQVYLVEAASWHSLHSVQWASASTYSVGETGRIPGRPNGCMQSMAELSRVAGGRSGPRHLST